MSRQLASLPNVALVVNSYGQFRHFVRQFVDGHLHLLMLLGPP